MSECKVSYNCSMGLMNMVFIVFLVLKLTKVVDWSWWWITAPLWGQAALLVLVLVVIAAAEVFCGRGRSKRCY